MSTTTSSVRRLRARASCVSSKTCRWEGSTAPPTSKATAGCSCSRPDVRASGQARSPEQREETRGDEQDRGERDELVRDLGAGRHSAEPRAELLVRRLHGVCRPRREELASRRGGDRPQRSRVRRGGDPPLEPAVAAATAAAAAAAAEEASDRKSVV